jgi:hypothetical protein
VIRRFLGTAASASAFSGIPVAAEGGRPIGAEIRKLIPLETLLWTLSAAAIAKGGYIATTLMIAP